MVLLIWWLILYFILPGRLKDVTDRIKYLSVMSCVKPSHRLFFINYAIMTVFHSDQCESGWEVCWWHNNRFYVASAFIYESWKKSKEATGCKTSFRNCVFKRNWILKMQVWITRWKHLPTSWKSPKTPSLLHTVASPTHFVVPGILEPFFLSVLYFHMSQYY